MNTSSKKCKECLDVLPMSAYYKHKDNKDGRFNKCKECVKKRVAMHRLENIDKIREYDRNRPNREERLVKNSIRVNNLKNDNPEKYKKTVAEPKKEWNRRNRGKRKAHLLVSRKIKNKHKFCSKCGSTNRVEAHHPDYKRPLLVVWLCSKCHGREHAIKNEINRVLVRGKK